MHGKTGWVVAVAAIALSITGSATAAKLITGKQVKNNSLTGQDVRNGSLAADDLSGGARESLKGNVGPAGPAGVAGAPGPQGPAGTSGLSTITMVKARTELCSGSVSCSIGSARAVCPPGSKPVSGGGATVSLNGLFMSFASAANAQADGWAAGGNNWGGPSGAFVEAYAYCSTGVSSFQTTYTQQARSIATIGSLVEKQVRMHEAN